MRLTPFLRFLLKVSSKLENLFQRLYVKSIVPKREFSDVSLQKAINVITYGCKATLLRKQKKSVLLKEIFIYINESSLAILECINTVEKFRYEIDVGKIIHLSDFTTIRLTETYANRKPMMLNLNFADQKEILLFFDSEQTKLLVWQGLLHLMEIGNYVIEK